MSLEALNVQLCIDQLKASQAAFNIAVIDACRNDIFKNWPAESRGDDDRGFRPISNLSGLGNMYLAMATGWGQVAQNGTGRNGIYTESLLKYLQAGQELERVLRQAAIDVKQRTGQRQNPQLLSEPATDQTLTF